MLATLASGRWEGRSGPAPRLAELLRANIGPLIIRRGFLLGFLLQGSIRITIRGIMGVEYRALNNLPILCWGFLIINIV